MKEAVVRWWRRRGRSDPEQANAGLAVDEECEAFLRGRYRELLERRGQPIPAWAWINGVAHGSEADVERLAATRGSQTGPAVFVACIARALLAEARNGSVPLQRVQQQALIPLELVLAADRLLPVPDDASALCHTLSAALGEKMEPIVPRRGDGRAGPA